MDGMGMKVNVNVLHVPDLVCLLHTVLVTFEHSERSCILLMQSQNMCRWVHDYCHKRRC